MKRLVLFLNAVLFLFSAGMSPVVEANFLMERAVGRPVRSQGPVPLPPLPFGNGAGVNPSGRTPSRIPPSLAKRFPILSRLPMSFLTVTDGHEGTTDQLVLHIKDIHENGEAQAATVRILKDLAEQGVDLIAVEGAAGAFDFSRWRQFPGDGARNPITDHMLNAGKISGSSYFGMTEDHVPPVWGIEDPDGYLSNVESYRKSLAVRPLYRMRIERLTVELESLKSKLYSPEMHRLDHALSEFRSGRGGLTPYVQALVSFAGKNTEQTKKVIDMVSLEKSMDFNAVGRERDRWIRLAVENLDAASLSLLVNEGLKQKSGQCTPAEFYRTLQTLSETKGISLATFPAFSSYIRYVLRSADIDPTVLMNDLDDLRDQALMKTVRSSQQARLAGLSEKLSLTQNLVEFSLVPSDWNRVRRLSPSLSGLEAERAEIAGQPLVQGSTGSDDLATFMAFYEKAEFRNQTLTDNCLNEWSVLRENKESKTPAIAILITGGFHADGMSEAFKQKRISYVGLAPKIENVPNGSGAAKYLDAFTRERTVLENSSPEKSFLFSRREPRWERSLPSDRAPPASSRTQNGRWLWARYLRQFAIILSGAVRVPRMIQWSDALWRAPKIFLRRGLPWVWPGRGFGGRRRAPFYCRFSLVRTHSLSWISQRARPPHG